MANDCDPATLAASQNRRCCWRATISDLAGHTFGLRDVLPYGTAASSLAPGEGTGACLLLPFLSALTGPVRIPSPVKPSPGNLLARCDRGHPREPATATY